MEQKSCLNTLFACISVNYFSDIHPGCLQACTSGRFVFVIMFSVHLDYVHKLWNDARKSIKLKR